MVSYFLGSTQTIRFERERSQLHSPNPCREEEAIQLDGLSVAEMKLLREQAEKFAFQAEVNRMMKLIINSLYRNKEVCISNSFISMMSSLHHPS